MTVRNLRFNLDLNANTEGLQQGFNGAKFAVNALAGALAALGVGFGLRELAEAADSYTNLSTRIQIATREHGNFNEAIAGVHQIAISTNSTLEETATLFTRLNTVGKDMGMTQQQALDLTKTITQAIQISGGSAQASEAAITQFIQAMQGGVLRGEEFNSIMENGFGLAEALAKGLGVTTGELRKMAENGELTNERVVKALQSQASAIQSIYDQFPTTIGNALQRIATSWEILIGKMDQANGASATVATWLVTLADNINIVEILLKDMGEGFFWVGEQLKKIDVQTIESLKNALITTYGAVKELASTVGSAFVITLDLLNDVLGVVFNFGNGVDEATSKTNGFTKILQMLNVAIGIASDSFAGVNIGLNLLVGALYSASSAFVNLLSTFTWGSVKEAALQNMAEMQAKAEEYYERASQAALNFESKSIAAYTEITKTAEQKNQEALDNSTKTFTELSKKNEEFSQKVQELADERISIEEQLNQARKDGHQSTIDSILQKSQDLETREKEYAANKAILDQELLASVRSYAEAAITANKGVMDGVMQADLMTKGYIVTVDEMGKVAVESWRKATEAQKGSVDSITQARKAAKELKLDLYELKNGYTEAFGKGQEQVSQFAKEVENLGFKGEKAGDAVYEAWLKWLNTAKSQGEIDFAKSKLVEFEEQGVFSAKQVENGMQAVRLVTQKLPADIDPVTAAFERLGIKTKEQLKLAADFALADFNTIQASGQATAESLKQAYERTMQAAAASGDQAIIAATQAKAASLGLQVQISDTGQASVKSMDALTESNNRVYDSANRIGDGYRHAGQVARDEAQSVKSEWEKAVDAASDKFREYMKQQSKALGSLDDYDSYSKDDVIQQLKSMGYSDSDAKKRASSIWSEAMAADRDAKLSGMGKSGFGGLNNLTNAEFDKAAKAGVTTQYGTNKINDLLKNISVVSTGASVPGASSASTSKSALKDVNYNIDFGGQKLSLVGEAGQEDVMSQLVKQLQGQVKST